MTLVKDRPMYRVFLAALLALASAPALAQQPAPSLGGPQVPNVCLLSRQAVLSNSKVGLAATARLKGLADQAQADIDAQRNDLARQAQALQAQHATLQPADFQQRQQALGRRLKDLEAQAQLKSRQIELTRDKALGQIAQDAQPVVAEVYRAHGCGLLIDRNSVLGGNMAGDLTAAVVQGLDAKVATIAFDLAALPAGGAAQPAAMPAGRP
jgi:Skp family chaperone for outer membrane proteins